MHSNYINNVIKMCSQVNSLVLVLMKDAFLHARVMKIETL